MDRNMRSDGQFRSAVRFVALANLSYFLVELTVAQLIGSVSLFADSVDFLEDAAVNILILAALGWSARARARLGMGLAGLLLAPAIATIWTLWLKFASPSPPAPIPLSAAGLGALAVNLICAFRLARFRAGQGSLARAAFFSARNDAIANIAIIAAAGVTLVWPTIWPDVVVGVGIGILNLGAAHEVWQAARNEHDASP
jgi:Co/Zn/Cd efflux system component